MAVQGHLRGRDHDAGGRTTGQARGSLNIGKRGVPEGPKNADHRERQQLVLYSILPVSRSVDHLPMKLPSKVGLVLHIIATGYDETGPCYTTSEVFVIHSISSTTQTGQQLLNVLRNLFLDGRVTTRHTPVVQRAPSQHGFPKF